jgi:hypothetical protein
MSNYISLKWHSLFTHIIFYFKVFYKYTKLNCYIITLQKGFNKYDTLKVLISEASIKNLLYYGGKVK